MISFNHVRSQNNGFPYSGVQSLGVGVGSEKNTLGNFQGIGNVLILHLNCAFTVYKLSYVIPD